MRIALRMFGLDLLDLEVTTDPPQPEYDQARDLSGGTLGSMPVGFTRWETVREDDGKDYE